MDNKHIKPLRAQVVDWDRPPNDVDIAARLDSLEAIDLPDAVRRREVLETLDVLAEELVGRRGPHANLLKDRVQSMLRQLNDSTSDTGANPAPVDRPSRAADSGQPDPLPG